MLNQSKKEKYKKTLRLTPLNEEIKKVEARLYKNDYQNADELVYLINYLQGLKTAHTLVKTIK